jgi:hypothetical protein
MRRKTIVLFLLVTIIVEVIAFAFWLIHCKNFQEILHVNFSQLALQLKGEAGQDYGLPFFVTRFFHNKLIDAFLLTIKTYFKFWDFLFFGELFPFLGSFGILAAGYYFFVSKSKRILHWIVLIIFLLLPFAELFLFAKIPFLIRIGLFYIFFGFISLVGIRQFVKSQKWAWIVILVLTIVSVWWLLIADFHLATFCYQYPLV